MDDQPWDWERILEETDDSDLTDYGAADEKRGQGSADNRAVPRRSRKDDSKGSREALAERAAQIVSGETVTVRVDHNPGFLADGRHDATSGFAVDLPGVVAQLEDQAAAVPIGRLMQQLGEVGTPFCYSIAPWTKNLAEIPGDASCFGARRYKLQYESWLYLGYISVLTRCIFGS